MPAEDARLHRRAQRDHFVGIEIGVRLRAEQRLHRAANHGNARRAADQHHFVNLLDRHARIFDAGAARSKRAVDDIRDQLFEKLARVISRW